MAAKPFAVDDVLPATTQLKVTWEINDYLANRSGYITTTNDYLWIYFDLEFGDFEDGWIKVNNQLVTYLSIPGPYEIIINTSSWNLSRRTVTHDTTDDVMLFYWEDLNAPTGYTITFNSNGGTTITDIEEATELPTLPIPTRTGYTFVAWYYESNFQTRAKAGDTIEANTTLYAKWHNLGSLFTEIADAIRSKDGTSENIRDVDFGERVKQIQGAKEEQTKTVSPTTSSQDVLPDANKVLSKVTVNAIPTETKSQQPVLSSGDQTINATSGKFMTSFTITKDTINHIASNIRSGTTLYGVTGNLQPAKEEETKTITPNFSSGNVVVTPTSGKVMTQVTINKDTTNHVAGNIKNGVTLYGVTGTYEGGVPLEQFVQFRTADGGGTYYYRLLTFLSRNPHGWGTPVNVKIYYDSGGSDVLLVSKEISFDRVNFIVIPRSYGVLKIVMSLVPSSDYGWNGFFGFYAKTASPNVVAQLTAPSGQDDFVLSYIDFDVFHVVFTAYGD